MVFVISMNLNLYQVKYLLLLIVQYLMKYEITY
nr:MAG TPA: hypothetical protein [Caudoviricetes sp.]